MNVLRRAGCLEAGFRGGLRWPQSSGRVAHVDVQASADALHVGLLMGSDDAGWTTTSHLVPVVRLPCAKGGSRPLFACPNTKAGQPCGRRARKLYLHGRRLACHVCLDLAYPSQSEPPDERLLRKACRLRQRLGETEWQGIGRSLPPRPRGMHRTTHDRLVEQLYELEDQICMLGAARLGI